MSARIITCDSCGRERPKKGYAWCTACISRWRRAGRPPQGPPPRRTGRYDEYAELTREQHYTLRNAAARMGISERTAWRYEARLRAAGIQPATYQSGQIGVHVIRVARIRVTEAA